MTASPFIERYRQACTEVGCEVLPGILNIDAGSPKLALSSQTLAAQGSLAVAHALAHSKFSHIELCNCYVNDEGCRAICEALKGNTFLKHLNLSGNNFGSESADHLRDLLLGNTSLESLLLEWNSLGMKPVPFARLCEAVACSKTLTSIDLRNNRIGYESAHAVAKMVEANSSLTQLDLRWNRIGPKGGDLVAQAMGVNSTLLELMLTGNDISYATLMAIDSKVQSNAKLRQDTQLTEAAQRHQAEYRQSMLVAAERMKSEVAQRDVSLASEREKLGGLVADNEALRADLRRATLDCEMLTQQLSGQKGEADQMADSHAKSTGLLQANYEATLAGVKEAHAAALAATQAENAALREELREQREEAKAQQERAEAAEAEKARQARRADELQAEVDEERLRGTEARQRSDDATLEGKKKDVVLARLQSEVEMKAASNEILAERKGELEAKVLELERACNALEAQVHRADLETERRLVRARDEATQEKEAELERVRKKLHGVEEDVLAKVRVAEELRASAGRLAEQHSREVEEVGGEAKRAKERAAELEVELHRLHGLVSAAEAEKKRAVAELEGAEDRRAVVLRELDNAGRAHQAELDRLSERFATDRLDLEKRLLVREERLSHVCTENQELSKRLARVTEEFSTEKERIQRRVTDQIRIIFDEAAPTVGNP
eukprot:Rhum_TRINITY_DN17182_c0_g1::Rhum_TRINITY_DN17182_c0_g1_i1::g.165443::m.165443